MKILFALSNDSDDSLETRILSQYKEKNGYGFEFDRAINLSEISEKLASDSYDLIILNEELEANNPITLEKLRHIKNISKETRIILVFNNENKDDAFIRALQISKFDSISSDEIIMGKVIDLIMGKNISETRDDTTYSNKLRLFNINKEKSTTTQKVITKEIVKYIPATPHDYKKIIGVLGCKQKGKTTIIDLLATQLSAEKIKVAVLDLTKEGSFYRLKCWSNQEEGDRDIKRLELLENGERIPFEIDKYYHLYAQNKFNVKEYDVFKAVEVLKANYDIVFIDLSRIQETFKYIFTDIYFVHDLNILDLIEFKNLIRKVKKNEISLYKTKIIINKVINSKVKLDDIIQGLRFPLNEIEEEKEENFIDIEDNKIFSIPFSLKLMENSLNAAYNGDEFISISDEIKSNILEIARDIYPMKVKRKGILEELFKTK